jgi:formylglycine-generating enzyme required for sulfatase activity
MQKDGTWKQPLIPQTPEHPVIAVTYEEAIAFCDWLTLYEHGSGRIGSQDRYRLPSMAEWSIAAGLEADAHDPANAYPWHGTFPPPADAGNYASDELRSDVAFSKLPVISPRDDGHAYTAPVASYSPNQHGLNDMGGNVAEWIASTAGQETYTRGATWLDSAPEVLDAGYRPVVGRDTRSFILGFRMVLERSDPP